MFLKINFPKIIFVDSTEIFEMLNKLGTELINSFTKSYFKLDNSIEKRFLTLDKDKKQNKIIEKIFYKEQTNELYHSF